MTRSRHRNFSFFMLILIVYVNVLAQVTFSKDSLDAENAVDFAGDIAPIFEEHCIRCHLPGNEKGDVSLATIENLDENGYLDRDDAEQSYLLELIQPQDDKPPQMPKKGDSLSSEQVNLINRWIEQGAKWPDEMVLRERSRADRSWWSLQPLSASKDVPFGDVHAGAATIDQFIEAKLDESGLSLNPPADKRSLIRRATYDLTGLPPTPAEVEAFENDEDPKAYENLIDRLLASKHYGERWGRHWLDVVRFGESNGFEKNVIINDLWPFRDYVIQSLNDDKPFNQFIREHLAGDVFGKNQPDVEVATAFLVAGPYDDVGNQDPVQAAQIRANTIDEMIRATSEAFLGLTVGCARCHDHKFDPILQRDYYSLYATFSGVRHGSRIVATVEEREAHDAKSEPLEQQRAELTKQKDAINTAIQKRGLEQLEAYEEQWVRDSVDRTGTEEKFSPIEAKFVRLISEGQDNNPNNRNSFGIDEFQIWSAGSVPRNVALAANGATASGASREIEDFPGAYGPQLAIDGEYGERFLATGGHLTIELPYPTLIDRVVFSSAHGETKPQQGKFAFVAEYRIEVSPDGKNWREVANSYDRQPVNDSHRNHRLRELVIKQDEKEALRDLNRQLNEVNKELSAITPLSKIFVGNRVAADAKGPFHIFVGGSPQRPGEEVVPASLSPLDKVTTTYELSVESEEAKRRLALANWITSDDNPLTLRVLANRLWHYHFGTGIVDTPSDLGYMGSQPTHPELLDFLAVQLRKNNWQLKSMHKMIMLTKAYQQSSEYDESAAKIDADSRLLWRFPPRRLSAEEIRDTILSVTGKLDTRMGGPGFRLYHFMRDNVSTYEPLKDHGADTYRRAVYHQNARASVVDLMTDFDQPDCAFSTPKRAETTTPLQALTMLNHSFTMDMANALVERLETEAETDLNERVRRVYQLCYSRDPTDSEIEECLDFVMEHGWPMLCRVLLNTSELIYLN